MPTPKTKPELMTFRIDKKERQALGAEAEAMSLGVTAYVRFLVHTHPVRPKNKKK